MAMKKFINCGHNIVEESLSGLCSTYPRLDYHESKRVVLVPNWHSRGAKVSIICGGGSGHEPFSAGFVGSGMLTASVAGSVFAAPPSSHIYHALNCVSNDAGTLVIIPNYTGDCLNFGIAVERARQKSFKLVDLVVGDDCSIPIDEQGRAGKRGLVGMLYVIKIAGALAERGKPLEEVAYHAKIIADNIATYGVGLYPCSLPEQGLMFDLPEDEIEIGLGVHGEAGYDRIKMRNASEIVAIMLENICKSLSLISGDTVVVLINNFGATSQLEQGIVVHEVVSQLTRKEIGPVRVYFGVLMTSLNSAGVHISILKVPQEFKDLYISCLDDHTDAPCWPGCGYSAPPIEPKVQRIDEDHKKILNTGRKLNEEQTDILKKCLTNACMAIIQNEETLNNLDRGCGDGDCGTTHRLLADGILGSLENLNVSYPASLLAELSSIAEECMGGTSGAVYSLMFTTAASALANTKDEENWSQLWSRAWQCGINSVMKYSKAQLGDRTMIDALNPASVAFNQHLSYTLRDAIAKSKKAAQDGCDATKQMTPKAGRAAYVKQSKYFTDVDAGAFGVVIWINAITDILLN